jgi:hypothetical protein
MDDAERELYGKAIASGDVNLLRDALPEDPRTAVSVWFEAQGAANTVSEALTLLVPLEREVGVGIDPAFGRVRVDARGPEPLAMAMARRALAHELIGVSRAMLELARAHALERIQFDVPIASFQAVRHRLADSLVAIEAARAAADGAWDDGGPFTAMVAKAVAGRSARLVARHAQQVLAGIGFTAEHPFHHHFRRVRVLDHLLGSSPALTREIGAQLLADGCLPSPLPL